MYYVHVLYIHMLINSGYMYICSLMMYVCAYLYTHTKHVKGEKPLDITFFNQ